MVEAEFGTTLVTVHVERIRKPQCDHQPQILFVKAYYKCISRSFLLIAKFKALFIGYRK